MKSKIFDWSVLGTVCLFAFFVNNEIIVPDIMEARNIVTAREMVYEGHWVVPTMNGYIRLEKPPLPTWLTAFTEYLSPDNLFLQRAVAGLAACLLVIFFYLIALRIIKSRLFALVSSILLCTCHNVILLGRTASWDIYCHAFMLGAIYYFMKVFMEENYLRKDSLFAGLFLGLSFMSKGPVAFYALLFPFLLSYGYFYRPILKRKWKGIGEMLGLFIIVGFGWYFFIYLFHGEEFIYVMNKESNAWINYNVRPWFYYWRFFLETGIWAFLLLTAISYPLYSQKSYKNRTYFFFLFWMLLIWIFLSVLPEKKYRYLFPLLIPACYVMGYLLIFWIQHLYNSSKLDRILFRFNCWVIAGCISILPIFLYYFLYKEDIISFSLLILISVILYGITISIVVSSIKLRPLLMVGSVLFLFMMVESFILPFLKDIINNPEMKSISQVRDLDILKDIPFYYSQEEPLRIELVYAANRKIYPLNISSVDSIKSVLPCAILTHERVGNILPVQLWKEVDSLYIDYYDENRVRKENRRYTSALIYHITLLRKK